LPRGANARIVTRGARGRGEAGRWVAGLCAARLPDDRRVLRFAVAAQQYWIADLLMESISWR
jgi:hypothetical protein